MGRKQTLPTSLNRGMTIAMWKPVEPQGRQWIGIFATVVAGMLLMAFFYLR
jgi:hypothetical protein